MRIAQVVLSLDVGGQERLILSLARALVDVGHHVSIISLTPGGTLRAEFERCKLPIYDVPRRGSHPRMIFELARTLRIIRPDAVHTHNPPALVYGAPAARLVGVRRIVHTKHGFNPCGTASLWARRVITRMVTAFVPVSDETAAIARVRERPSEAQLKVIPNGIPLADFGRGLERQAAMRVREAFGLPADAIVVGSVGRLAAEKDYPLLVRAMAPLLGESVRLMLVGDGAERANIEAAIAAANVARWVTLTGMRSDVPALLAAMDVFAMSSKSEGLPLVIAEAMASNLPVVATAVGGVPGIVPATVGTLVASGDQAALTGALRALVEDTQKRIELGAAANLYARERFSLERMMRAYEALYR